MSMSDPREPLFAYIATLPGGRPEAAKKLGISYPLFCHICNGTRGVSKDVAEKMERGSDGLLTAERMVFIRPAKSAA